MATYIFFYINYVVSQSHM